MTHGAFINNVTQLGANVGMWFCDRLFDGVSKIHILKLQRGGGLILVQKCVMPACILKWPSHAHKLILDRTCNMHAVNL